MIELCIVGGGRMGEALLGGLLDRWEPASLAVVEISDRRRAELAERHPGVRVEVEVPAAAAGVVAVKPDDVPEAVAALAGAGATRVLSVAAGVRLAALAAAAGPGVAVVRAMPNTPALVGAGATAVAGDDDEALAWAEDVLAATGAVLRLPERHLDAVTGLSGSGPAYVFLVVEAMVEAGVLVGLPRDVATELAVQTVVGAGQLLAEDGRDAAELRASVTSPGGTTAAGLRELERAGVRAAFLDAVTAATARSRELGS